MITRAKFYMDNGTTVVVEVPGDATGDIDELITQNAGGIARFGEQRGARLSDKPVAIGVNLIHVVSFEISKL